MDKDIKSVKKHIDKDMNKLLKKDKVLDKKRDKCEHEVDKLKKK